MPLDRAEVRHGYLGGPRPLFASYHAPSGPARNIAYVVCPPLHYDLVQCYRSMRRLAEELAGAGFHVLRIHYDGTGESIGGTDRDPNRVEAWLESVRVAVETLRAIPNVESVGIVGVRIGATFALETSTRVDVSHLVLWEPSPGAFYAREMDILAASSPQRVQAGEAGPADEGLVAGGYFLGKQTLADLGRLDLEKMRPRGNPDVMIVFRDDRKASPRLAQHFERLELETTAVQLPGHKEMMLLPHKSVVPEAILAGIRDWAVQRSRVVEGDAPPGPALAPEVVVDGVRWRSIRFGSHGHLFGVLTEPEAGVKPGAAAVLLLTGGVVPRTSGNGSYVTIARRLASRGHAVLRMDVAMIGESKTPEGSEGTGMDAFPPTIVDDARAGLKRVCEAASPGADVWLLGLCSGAYASFQTMLVEERARGAFLLNPIVFRLEDGDFGTRVDEGAPAQISATDQIEQMNRYWQVMRDPEAWKKLLSGKADVRHLAKVVRGRVEAKVASAKERVSVRLGRPPKGLAGDFDRLLARGAVVNLVFSEGDPGHAGFLSELGARLDPLVDKGLHLRVFPGADHNFHEMVSRGELIDWVEATIAGPRA